MGNYTPTGFTPLSSNYGATTIKQQSVAITPNIGGDTIALVGQLVVVRFETAGTATVITFDSVELSNFGQDQNVTMTLGTTEIGWAAFKTDNRFKQTAGQIGNLSITYTSVTALKCETFYLA